MPVSVFVSAVDPDVPPNTDVPPLLPPKRDVFVAALLPPNREAEAVIVAGDEVVMPVTDVEDLPPKMDAPPPPKAVPDAGAVVTDPKADLTDPPNKEILELLAGVLPPNMELLVVVCVVPGTESEITAFPPKILPAELYTVSVEAFEASVAGFTAVGPPKIPPEAFPSPKTAAVVEGVEKIEDPDEAAGVELDEMLNPDDGLLPPKTEALVTDVVEAEVTGTAAALDSVCLVGSGKGLDTTA